MVSKRVATETGVKVALGVGAATNIEVTVAADQAERVKLLYAHFESTARAAMHTDWLDSGSAHYGECVEAALFTEFAAEQSERESAEDADAKAAAAAVAAALFVAFDKKYCGEEDIHVCVDRLELENGHAETVLRGYYKAQSVYLRSSGSVTKTRALKPALFGTAGHRLLGMFGGQGGVDNYIEETRMLYATYRPLVSDYVACMSEFLQQEAGEAAFSQVYRKGLDVVAWLESDEEVPDQEYMLSVPVSIPVVGLTQLMQVMVLFKTLGISPGELASSFEAIAGHSQGIATATALSLATDEESFYRVSKIVLGLLMLTGVYPQLDYPTAAASAQSIAATPMVSVLKLSRAQIAEAISKHNAQQKTDKAMVHLSLTNGAKMFVVSGATESIKGFVRALYKEHDTGGADQTRVRHSQRKSGVSTKYLSINAPYHCPLLGHAVEGACRYASSKGWELDSRDMRRAVRAGDDGHDIRGVGNLSQYLLQSMCVLPVDWCKAAGMDGVTHIVDFGPGGLSGFGVLTQRIVDGRGVPVICVGALSRQRSSGLGTKADMYKSKARELTAAANWEKQFRPGVVRTESDGKLHISTRMSRLLGKPPLMVAGMTPSTVSEVFVSAVMRAGYHVELSGGGHFSEEMLRDKVDRILELTEAGQGVSINSIYVNPFLWSIQYPAVQAMRREGIPMEGLCIGAGVPSFDVCSEIIASIREAGFRHIGLKPSSVETIRLVIKIAQANADFPILLQWTGGRGGGHHSFEDFHQPILDTYGAIRAQSNIVLVAGSGFGGVDDTLPYLTGDWSRRFDCAPMPFDGCLLGSRVMVAKEGAASDAVKAAIVAAPGVDDSEWEKTYSGPAGGIVTVLSEMGEPIHKIATRGVLFWKELDDTVFSLPRDKRLAALLGKKGYIIQRLNDDFQKPWFGKKADGSVADVEEMTYGEVAKRLVEVLYIKHQSRWIDVTMRNLVGDYLQRVEERFAGGERAAVLQSFEQINSPLGTVQAVLDAYPESQTQLLASEDVQFFINLCMRPGQKPVPFIPVMDKDFHIWFKKDSLWQSEDLDAVAGQDVGRVCILQGPVAVRYATKANEPVKDILDGIYHGQIATLLDQYYGGDERRVPVVGYVGEAPAACAVPAYVRVEASETERVFTLAATEAQLPKADAWLEAVAGSELGWLRALLTARVVAQGRRYADNVVRRVLRPRAGLVARVRVEGGRAQAVEVADASGRRALGIALEAGSTIRVSLYAAVRGAESALELLFRYRPQTPSVPIHEVVAGRDERTRRFYAHVWPGPSSGARLSNGAQQLLPADCAMRVFRDAGRVARAQDVDAFVSAVGVGGGGSGSAQGAPLDYAMCAFWPALAQCLLACGGNLRGLVHVSNTLRAVGAMRAGQRLSSEAWITEAVDGAGGRAVAVAGRVLSDGAPAVEIETAFLLRGSGGGSGSGPGSQPRGFRHVREAPAILRVADARMLALLRAKEWLVPAPAAAHLLRVGARLVFRLESRHRLGPRAHVATFGAVLAAARGGAWAHVACVDYESGTARGNAVLDFLARHAAPEHARTPVPPRAAGAASLRVPPSGAAFAAAGGDHNPIHTSAFFADAAGLPGPIAHGLWTAAAARAAADAHAPGRVRAFAARFVAAVRPAARLDLRMRHVAFERGRRVVHVTAATRDGARVLDASAEVAQPPTAYLFPGQGAHAVAMGMARYAESPPARAVWDAADAFMRATYAVPLLDIVRRNPRSLTVHFVGPRGAAVRAAYRAMAWDAADGAPPTPFFPDIAADALAYTFAAPAGLLNATQFTQPALLVCEVAEFAHLRACGVVPPDAAFAGHSLGEFAGLCAVADVMTPEAAADIGFCRGLAMLHAVPRDSRCRSSPYAMAAVNPARVRPAFGLDGLQAAVDQIRACNHGLLEVVNHNVPGSQYVVAGERLLLDALSHVLDALACPSPASPHSHPPLSELALCALRAARLRRAADASAALPTSRAFVPLPAIDVPFHSTILRPGVPSFRRLLQAKISPEDIDPARLRHRYVPNLTARPFDTTREYLQDVHALTASPPLALLLLSFDDARLLCDAHYERHVAYVLLVELLSYQFASPVRWIESQHALLHSLHIERFVQVGPGSVLTNILHHTLASDQYAAEALADSVAILSTDSDMDRILYQDAEELSQSPEVPASDISQPADSSQSTDSSQPTSSSQQQESTQHQEPTQHQESLQRQPPANTVQELPVPSLDIIRALVALKLKCSIDAVSPDKPIKDLVAGKSTLQNEIIGDLQKEFTDDLPEKPEEVPLAELAHALLPLPTALGKLSHALLARLIATRLPGGFTRDALTHHLHHSYGLGPLRQSALLLVALTMQPSARLDSDSAAKAWLATVAREYARLSGVSYSLPSANPANTPMGSAASAVPVASSHEFRAAQHAHRHLARQTMLALASYLGVAVDPNSNGATSDNSAEPSSTNTSAMAELDIWSAEYGSSFYEGIKPAFSAPMARRYDSYWNWARQDLMELYYDMVRGNIRKVDLVLAPHCLRLVNRFSPSVVDALKYVVQNAASHPTSPGHMLAQKYGAALIQKCSQAAAAAEPVFQFTLPLLAPRILVDGSGAICYSEVPRPGERSIRDYVDAVTGENGFAVPPRRCANDALDTVLNKLGLLSPAVATAAAAPATAKRQLHTHSLPPMVHAKSKAADPTAWAFDPTLSAVLANALHDICDNGLALSGRQALLTGCGQGSIGSQVLRGLLEAGASVVVTTSSYSPKSMRFFQDIYQRHGSRGSVLVVVPFNQASRQDVDALVEYIYADTAKGRGLGWDLDYVLPFAAIPELGCDITDLGTQSELAHRAMLTNLFRLLGSIATQKARRRLDMHPTLAVLPLSPNHGTFGSDGHYSESKIGLETLLDRWHSEPAWQPYISLVGAVIGWTRGTGLMSSNNLVTECVERLGVRTFSSAEMAFNLLALLHPRIYAQAALRPVWADLAGRFQYYPDAMRSITDLRRALADMKDILKAVAIDALADFAATADEETERVYGLRKITALANHRFKFPALRQYDQLQHLRHLQGMVNLDKVVVVTGYGEVGPHGNAETRWQMEAYGEYSLEGCIELAWIMGLIKHYNGKHKATGKIYTGWVDAQTEEPVSDRSIKARYEKHILSHTGIRMIEPEQAAGYDPTKKPIMRELQIEHDMEPFETTAEEAAEFKLRNGDRVRIWPSTSHADGSDSPSWSVRFLKGATLMVPKALRFDRLVAAQVPAGWDPIRFGIPENIASQVDPITCYAIVATVEALVRSGITDPYELYQYVHVSEVGSSTGSGLGGLQSTKKVFAERMSEVSQAPDVYQETFISTPPAWINMLLMSASGPIKTTVGACATGIASIDVAVDTIQAGKAKVMLAGGTDGFCEESSYEFAQMGATSNYDSELRMGRPPAEMSRPCTTTRSGFMESEGAGVVTLMAASTAIEMGAPIYGIVAMVGTATDKEGRSVPAPGKGVLTSARELPSAVASPLLSIDYRRRQLELRRKQIDEWAEREISAEKAASASAMPMDDYCSFVTAEARRQYAEALDTWGNEFWKQNVHIAPLRGALAVWGLSVDDIGIASFHGTSTKANDKNESEIIERQLRHLGRTPGNVVFSVCQKYLTGHPKGPAAIWMLNGMMQSLATGLVPGNRNADNIAAELEQCEYIVYPSRSIQTPGIKAGLLKSFGFGQVGAECLMVHPDYLFATLTRDQLESYQAKASKREARAYRYWHNSLVGAHSFVQIKSEPPYSADQEESFYLDPQARVGRQQTT